MLLGRYDPAYAVVTPLRKTRVAAGARLDLELDWLDAAGERGDDMEADWDALEKETKLTQVAQTRARIKQRRGAFLTRRGDVDRAQQCYREAAAIWVGVEDAEDQVAEALASGVVAASINGKTGAPLPFAAGAAAPLARGHAQVAAVRAELLTRRGLGYLVEGNYPDALKHLTMALALSRREGNLADARNGRMFLGRAYEGAYEPVEALRFFVQAGAEKAATAVARELAFADIRDVLRLENAPPWELATSFSALTEIAPRLAHAEAAEIGDATIKAATPPPSVFAPDPAGPARRLLARIVPLLPDDVAARATPILRDEVETHGFNEQLATTALIDLFKRDLAPDAIELFKAALLEGRDLPVTIAGWLRDASKKEQKPIVDAAFAGNRIALIEAARAGLPETWPELKDACKAAIEAATDQPDDSEPISEITVSDFMVSSVGLGEMAKFVDHALRKRLEEHLIEVLLAAEFDDLSKVSALIAITELAPALPNEEAHGLLPVAYAFAEGNFPASAPAEVLSHSNPKRARSRISRRATQTQMRAAGLQAATRLTLSDEHPQRLEQALAAALASGEPELARTALRMLAERPTLAIAVELDPLLTSDDRSVRAAAERLNAARGDGAGANDAATP
jgi:tetratricopeptide (TPR) repeat protein